MFLLLSCGSEPPRILSNTSEVTSQEPRSRTLEDTYAFTGLKRRHAESLNTRYPVVFHHGLCGFDKILFVDYYYKIPEHLKSLGVDVHSTKVSPVATIKVRAQELATQIGRILAQTGASKVNLIGHSMGGLDARYLISTLGYGDRVATLTTLGTPHQGTLIADLIYRAVKSGKVDGIIDLLQSLTGRPPSCKDLPTRQCDRQTMRFAWNIRGVAWNLSEEFLKNHFNPQNPPDPRVQYQSYSGIASRWGWPGRPPKVEEVFSPIYLYLKTISGDNDGLVPTTSAVHGFDRGILPADHLDLIGHLLGATGGRYDHVAFFKNLVKELQNRDF